jgi:hypothetical protein
MKVVISLLAAVSLIVTGVPALKVNAQVDISNTPSKWSLGIISANSTYQTDLDHFTVTNNGTEPVNITISGSNMTGGIPWTLSPTADPGPDTYGLRAGLEGGSYNVTVNETDTILIGNLTDNSTQRWGLEFLSPTSFSDTAEKSGTVTLTATAI